MAVIVLTAVGLAVLKNAGELALGMIFLVAMAALGTRWPYQQPDSQVPAVRHPEHTNHRHGPA